VYRKEIPLVLPHNWWAKQLNWFIDRQNGIDRQKFGSIMDEDGQKTPS
jgi:hypothetical protein